VFFSSAHTEEGVGEGGCVRRYRRDEKKRMMGFNSLSSLCYCRVVLNNRFVPTRFYSISRTNENRTTNPEWGWGEGVDCGGGATGVVAC